MQRQAIQYAGYEGTRLPVYEPSVSPDYSHVLAMVLAGGKGERLYPLTGHRAKPAVPFGGSCRLIDFVLSNMVNSAVPEIHVLTQHNDHSLLRHLEEGWTRTYFSDGPLIMPMPARLNGRGTHYLGTADAVYKNRSLIARAQPEAVLVFGSDHVYCMDVRHMIRYHLEQGAEVTVSTIPMPVTQCAHFGTVAVDEDWRVRRFEEKTPFPTPIPDRPDQALVSMGNYIFDPRVLSEILEEDAHDSSSSHDFGRDILPAICSKRRVYAYDFRTNAISHTQGPTDYWRDVGTVGSYYRAHMDLNSPLCHLNLHNPHWPVRSANGHHFPSTVMEDLYGKPGGVENSVLAGSTIVSGGYVRNSVIGPRVTIASGAVVEDSVIIGDVVVEERARIQRAIIDHGNVIRAGERIGCDPDSDADRYYLDKSGIVVVPHNPRPSSGDRRVPS
jgi:glucose-1-phosphate adenylyltransferase